MENSCKIVLFGDSITKDYADVFERQIRDEYKNKKITVINAGIGGETSWDGLKRIKYVLKESPQVVVIGFGMNDWRKGVGKKQFKQNITKMIKKIEKKNIRVILTTIIPDYQGLVKGTSSVIDEYNCAIKDIAQEKRVKIADINSLWKREIWPIKKGLRNAIHPNKLGNKVICKSLMKVVPQSHTVVLWQYNGRECKCNYKCPYCYYSYSPKEENYFFGDMKDWYNAFKKNFGNQKLIFYLAFGEPTLGEAFYKIVEMIENEPNWKLRITTNLSQDLEKLMKSRLVKEGRLFINASFHPTQVKIDGFIKKLQYLRKHGIESPVVYVMWPPHLKRFESDFKKFNENDFLIHIRRFIGRYKGKNYPKDYTDDERRFIAKYCDDTTIRYMLNEKPVINRETYSGFHFFVVDSTGNIGLDSDCFGFHTKYRTIFGNIIQSHTLKIPFEPNIYPLKSNEGTVDGVSNYLELGYHQLEDNNVLDFARQGGIYHTHEGVYYKNFETNFNKSKIRAEYWFPSRNLKDLIYKFFYIMKTEGLIRYACFKLRNILHLFGLFIMHLDGKK